MNISGAFKRSCSPSFGFGHDLRTIIGMKFRRNTSTFFGGKDPFNDPFFSRPFGSSVFDSTAVKDPLGVDKSSGVIIEELDSDDDGILLQDKDNIEDVGKRKNQENKSAAGTFPVIEHPDDQLDEESANKSSSMELSLRIDENKIGVKHETRGWIG